LGGAVNKSEAGKLILEILSIYAFIQALGMLQFPISMLQIGSSVKGTSSLPIVSFVPVALIFLFSGVLWLSARQPEPRPESSAESSASSSGITPEILQSIAFSVAGIFIIIGTLEMLLNVFAQIVQIYINIRDGFPEAWRGLWIPLTETLIRLILGIWLLLGANGLRRLKASLSIAN
jgi:hypothetical protein